MPEVTRPELNEPGVKALAELCAQTGILAIQKAIGNAISENDYPIAPNTMEAAFQAHLKALPQDKRTILLQNGQKLLATDAATRATTFGKLASVDLHAASSVADAAKATGAFRDIIIDKAALATITAERQKQAPKPPVAISENPFRLRPQSNGNEVQFWIDNLHCDRVTGLIGASGDNITMGGVKIDSLGNTTVLEQIPFGSFHDGDDDFALSPGAGSAPLTFFDVETISSWPKTYTVVFILDEVYGGGLTQYVEQLAGYVKSAVDDEATDLGTTIGGIVGTAIGGLIGTVIGAVVGAAIGWALGKIVDWFEKQLFSDDIFTPATNYLDAFAGQPVTGSSNWTTTVWDIQGFHGEYHVTVHWDVLWGSPNVNACWLQAVYTDGNGRLTWSEPDNIGGVFNYDLGVASRGTGILDIVGVGMNGELWYKSYDSAGWHDWSSIGGQGTTGPAIAAQNATRIDVVVRGLDQAIWHCGCTNGVWSSWDSLGGTFISAPAACSWASGRLDVFAVGANGRLLHKWYDQAWSGWEDLGAPSNGALTSGPSAVAPNSSRIDILARGADDRMWHLYWVPQGWTPWKLVQGTSAANYRPAISTMGSSFHMFTVGQDNALYGSGSNFESPSDWFNLGGIWTSAPAAVSTQPGRTEVVIRGQ